MIGFPSPCLATAVGQHPEELVIAADPGQVARAPGGQFSALVVVIARPFVLQVPGPDHLQGLGAVEVDTGGGLDVQARLRRRTPTSGTTC